MAAYTGPTTPATTRWSAERAQAWAAGLPWLVGGNFTPSTASNQLEMWQAETFDPVTIDRELGWAAAIGMTSMRVFLHDLCWAADPAGFLQRIDRFLAIAARHRIGALMVFFDSCWHPEPRAGVQAEPLPHVHNSRWVQSPGTPLLLRPDGFAGLQGYVQGVMRHFANDPRIHGWDLWNEPDNDQSGKPFGHLDLGRRKGAVVLPCLAQCFAWARAVGASQPLTSGVWSGSFADDQLTPLQRLQIDNSDILSFHCYGDETAMATCLEQLAVHRRPLWCTEYMSRPASTFATALPLLAARRVGAYNWGLVAGRTQTHYSWDSWTKAYPDGPAPWFHEVFHPDGRPYAAAETDLIRGLASAAAR